MMLFVSALIAIMVGSLSSMREIVKEMEIYRRERMVSLQIVTFCLRSGSAYWCLCIKLLFSYCSRNWLWTYQVDLKLQSDLHNAVSSHFSWNDDGFAGFSLTESKCSTR